MSSTSNDTPSGSTPSTPLSTGFGRRRLLQLAAIGTVRDQFESFYQQHL